MGQTLEKPGLKRVAEQFRRRLSRILLAVGIARATVAAVVLFALAAAADWLFHIPWGWRIGPLVVFLGALFALVHASIRRPLREKWSDKQILAWLDHLSSGSSMLLDRYELSEAEGIEERHDPEGRRLLEEAIAATASAADTDDMIRRSFRASAARRWLLAAAAALGLVALAAAALPAHTQAAAVRFFNPFSTTRWPHRTTIAVAEPEGGWVVPQGEPLTVMASVSGVETPPNVTLAYRATAGEQWIRERLAVRPDRTVQYTFPDVREPLQFYLSGGDDTTDEIRVQIIRRPSLEKIVVRLESPPYSGVPLGVREGGDVEGLEGSHARIEFTSSIPVRAAQFALDGEKAQSLPVTGGRTFATELTLTKSTGYTVTLLGESGFREARPERYEIRVRPDAPPEAEIISPDRQIEGTAGASYKVSFQASDDFELARAELLFRMDNGAPTPLSDRVTGPIAVRCRKTAGTFTWDLAQMNVPSKDTVTLEYFVLAADANPTGRGVTESSHHVIRVLRPSLYREALLVKAKSLVNEALLAERNQRLAYQAATKFLSSAGGGEQDDPTWRDVTAMQARSSDAAGALSSQLAALLDSAAANRIQTEFMTVRLAQIAEVLRGVVENQHANIERQLDAARPRDAAQADPAALKALRARQLETVHDAENGQKRAALELQRVLFLVFDWTDLQSAAVSGLRLYEQQDECSRQTAAIAPLFLGKDIKDLSDADQERLLVVGKAQRLIYDAETVLEGHLEQILTKAERQGRQSIRVPTYAAYSELRNRRVRDRLRNAAEAISNNQPADILDEQKTALDALRVVKAGLEAAGAPERLAAIPLATELADVDAEDTRSRPGVEATLPPPPLMATDRQGTDPLTTAILDAGDAVRDVVRRSEYLAGHDPTGDLPRFQRLRFGRLGDLGAAAGQSLRGARQAAGEAGETFLQGFLQELGADMTDVVRLIGEKDITAGARQIGADAAAALDDAAQLLASKRAVREMKDLHDGQGGVDPFNRPYELQGADLAAAADAVDGLLELRAELQRAGRTLRRLAAPARTSEGLLASLEAGRRERLRGKQQELARRWAGIQQQLGTLSEPGREKAAEALGDLRGQDPSASLGVPSGQEADGSSRIERDVGKLAEAIRQVRDLLDARGSPPPPVAAATAPAPQETSRMTEAEYARLMSLPALRERVARAPQLPAALRDALAASLSRPFPPEQQRFLAAYVNAILSAAEEQNP